MGDLIFKNITARIVKYLPFFLVALLPLTLVLPHLGSSFFGTDFLFPYNKIGDFHSVLTAWTDDYLGDRNISAGSFLSLSLASLSFYIFGPHFAPHFYIYVTLVAYLLTIYFLVRKFRIIAGGSSKRVLNDSALITFVFLSPVVLGYVTNYFSIGLILAMIPTGLALLFLISFILESKYSNLLIAGLISGLIPHAPSCFFFVGFACLTLIFMRGIKDTFIYISIFLLCSTVWLVPLSFSFLIPGSGSMSGDSTYITHIFNWYSNSANILTNTVFSIYPNNKLFGVISIGFYATLFITAYGVIILYIQKLNTFNKQIILHKIIRIFLIICIIGFAFSFGGKYATGVVFSFLWTNVSALHFFKSFTQILNVTFLFFVPILSVALATVSNLQKRVAVFGIVLCCGMIAIQIPDINNHIARGTIPIEYKQAKEIIDKDTGVYRILSLPEIPYIYFRWNGDWDQHVFVQRWFKNSVVYFNDVTPIVGKLIKPLDSDYTNFFIGQNFKYLIIHKDYLEVSYKPKEFTIDLSAADLVLDNDYFTLYKIKEEFFTNHIFTDTASTFTKLSDVRYQIYIPNLATTTKLTFLQSFDTGWTVIPSNVKGKCSEQNAVGNSLKWLYRTTLADDSHHVTQKYANGWFIDPAHIIDGYGEEYYMKNADNSIGVCLTLFYRPQVYFLFGTLLSVFALLVVLLNIAYLKYRERYA